MIRPNALWAAVLIMSIPHYLFTNVCWSADMHMSRHTNIVQTSRLETENLSFSSRQSVPAEFSSLREFLIDTGVCVKFHRGMSCTSLECVRFWCLARSEALEKALLHPSCSQTYGFSPVCERRWVFRFSRRE